MLRKILAGLLLLVVVLAVFVFYVTRRGFPIHSGDLELPGLAAEVLVERDAYGVPHISASSEEDLYLALGYTMAQDRLFQMEFLRAAGNGTLSEILGSDFLDTDRFLRRIMLRPQAPYKVVEDYPEPVQRMLRSYVQGVNRFLTGGHPLPLEFTLLGHTPRAWDVGDVLAIAKLQSWDLSYNYKIELIYRDILEKLGPEQTQDLYPYYDSGDFKLLGQGEDQGGFRHDLLAQSAVIEALVGGNGGSNNWVISGERTASGKPILASDPHLGGSRLPGPWYFAHLQAPGLNVAGGCFPGAPLVLIGHNERIAWGITNMGPDVQDLYIEQMNSQDTSLYLYRGEWRHFDILPQTIRVKDRDADGGFRETNLLVKRTVHGPVVEEGDQTLSLAWTGNLFHRDLVAFYGINHASDWEEFQTALKDFSTAPQNFVYADVAGNIGYTGAGKIPIRSAGDGRLPVPGWTGEYDWVSMIPFEDLPRLFNPREGFIVTANAEPVGPDYPYPMPGIYAPDYRTRRIRQLVRDQVPAMLMDQEAIQLDRRSLLAGVFLDRLLPVIPAGDSPYAQSLEDWDQILTPESGAAALYHEVLHRFLRSIWEDDLGPELTERYLNTWYISLNRWVKLLDQPQHPWFDDQRTPQTETRDDLLRRAFTEAVESLSAHFASADINTWSWGDLHPIEFHHAFESQGGFIRNYFNYGPFPFGGDGETINRATYDFQDPYNTTMTASMRMLTDLGEPLHGEMANASGQVGVAGHTHYTDLIDKWLAGRYVDLSLDLADLPEPVQRLRLHP